MNSLLADGLLDLPWWGDLIAALLLTHVTIVAVTVFLHRHQAHRALELHPLASHCFRFWLWLTTGMVTREWVAIHRKHHAKVDTPDDPHSPQTAGLGRVLWGGVRLYVRESHNLRTLERYGHGTPDDWLERNLYSRFVTAGLTSMALVDLILFGLAAGTAIFLAQIAWIPFWAAGVINGIGHYWGYRNWETADASTNIAPWGIFIGGEELHNNHHAFTTSAKLSNKWFEFDVGWMYIRLLETLHLARVLRVAPVPRLGAARPSADLRTLQAVIANRYDVMAHYARSLGAMFSDEREALRHVTRLGMRTLEEFEALIRMDDSKLTPVQRIKLASILEQSRMLSVAHEMRGDLTRLWQRSPASKDELVEQLQAWCQRADATGIPRLAQLSRRLRSYR